MPDTNKQSGLSQGPNILIPEKYRIQQAAGGVMQQWKEQPSAPAELSVQARNFVEEINRKRSEGEQAGQNALDAELHFLNKTRECGVLLEDAKATLSSSQWKLAQAEFVFNAQQVQGLLDFARKFPEPITDARAAVKSLQEAQMALGLALYPEGHGPQTIKEPNFALSFTKLLTNVRAEIRKGTTRAPIETWTASYAAQFVAQAEPLVDDINEILAAAKVKAVAE